MTGAYTSKRDVLVFNASSASLTSVSCLLVSILAQFDMRRKEKENCIRILRQRFEALSLGGPFLAISSFLFFAINLQICGEKYESFDRRRENLAFLLYLFGWVI